MALPAPFASQLGTNYCPRDSEILQIKALLVDRALRLTRIDDEIAELQKAVDKLVEERTSLAVYVADYKALISPARRVPPEIIQEIFLACIPTHRNCAMSSSDAPLLLGRICSSWRSISLSTPRLWTKLHFVQPNLRLPAAKIRIAQHLESAKMWLARSGQWPLSISLQVQDDPQMIGGPPPPLFLAEILPLASRWKHIEFVTPPNIIKAVNQLTESSVPLLETVVFRHQVQHHITAALRLQDFRILRGACVSGVSVLVNDLIGDSTSLLPWDQLTVLELTGKVQSTSMTSEDLLVVNDHIGGSVLQPVIELRYLHTLEIKATFANRAFDRLVARLLSPELRSFTFHANGGRESPDLATSFNLWTRLESLEMTMDGISKTSLLDGLNNLPPTIHRLVIHDVRKTRSDSSVVDDDVLNALALPGVCPALQTLEMDRCLEISETALMQLIIARLGSLKHVEVKFAREMQLDILPTLAPLILANGVGVDIRYPEPSPERFSPWEGLSTL
ncbi:hypothetical protein C8R46DRAFT_1285376 [Mycena filopes]|nr:hypothetical protein C8R46DRAFT_1285376 [Mycena filopes]